MTAPTDSFGTPMSHQSNEEDPSESELTPLLGNATQPNVNSQSENAGDVTASPSANEIPPRAPEETEQRQRNEMTPRSNPAPNAPNASQPESAQPRASSRTSLSTPSALPRSTSTPASTFADLFAPTDYSDIARQFMSQPSAPSTGPDPVAPQQQAPDPPQQRQEQPAGTQSSPISVSSSSDVDTQGPVSPSEWRLVEDKKRQRRAERKAQAANPSPSYATVAKTPASADGSPPRSPPRSPGSSKSQSSAPRSSGSAASQSASPKTDPEDSEKRLEDCEKEKQRLRSRIRTIQQDLNNEKKSHVRTSGELQAIRQQQSNTARDYRLLTRELETTKQALDEANALENALRLRCENANEEINRLTVDNRQHRATNEAHQQTLETQKQAINDLQSQLRSATEQSATPSVATHITLAEHDAQFQQFKQAMEKANDERLANIRAHCEREVEQAENRNIDGEAIQTLIDQRDKLTKERDDTSEKLYWERKQNEKRTLQLHEQEDELEKARIDLERCLGHRKYLERKIAHLQKALDDLQASRSTVGPDSDCKDCKERKRLLEERDTTIKDLRNSIERKDRNFATLEDRILELNKDLDQRDLVNESLDTIVDTLLASLRRHEPGAADPREQKGDSLNENEETSNPVTDLNDDEDLDAGLHQAPVESGATVTCIYRLRDINTMVEDTNKKSITTYTSLAEKCDFIRLFDVQKFGIRDKDDPNLLNKNTSIINQIQCVADHFERYGITRVFRQREFVEGSETPTPNVSKLMTDNFTKLEFAEVLQHASYLDRHATKAIRLLLEVSKNYLLNACSEQLRTEIESIIRNNLTTHGYNTGPMVLYLISDKLLVRESYIGRAIMSKFEKFTISSVEGQNVESYINVAKNALTTIRQYDLEPSDIKDILYRNLIDSCSCYEFRDLFRGRKDQGRIPTDPLEFLEDARKKYTELVTFKRWNVPRGNRNQGRQRGGANVAVKKGGKQGEGSDATKNTAANVQDGDADKKKKGRKRPEKDRNGNTIDYTPPKPGEKHTRKSKHDPDKEEHWCDKCTHPRWGGHRSSGHKEWLESMKKLRKEKQDESKGREKKPKTDTEDGTSKPGTFRPTTQTASFAAANLGF